MLNKETVMIWILLLSDGDCVPLGPGEAQQSLVITVRGKPRMEKTDESLNGREGHFRVSSTQLTEKVKNLMLQTYGKWSWADFGEVV